MNIFSNKWIIHNTNAAILMLALFLFASTVYVIKKTQYIKYSTDPVATVRVTGSHELTVVPEIATFTFAVIKDGKTSSESQQEAAKAANKILDYLKNEAGIPEKDIKTLSLNTRPVYEWISNCSDVSPEKKCLGDRVLAGYQTTQRIRVKVKDKEKAGEIIANITDLGADQVSGLSFEIEDEEKLKQQARKLAIEDAKQKAKQLAKDLDVELVRIVSYSENAYSNYARPMYKAMALEVAMYDEAPIAPELPSGESKVKANVTLEYEIR